MSSILGVPDFKQIKNSSCYWQRYCSYHKKPAVAVKCTLCQLIFHEGNWFFLKKAFKNIFFGPSLIVETGGALRPGYAFSPNYRIFLYLLIREAAIKRGGGEAGPIRTIFLKLFLLFCCYFKLKYQYWQCWQRCSLLTGLL